MVSFIACCRSVSSYSTWHIGIVGFSPTPCSDVCTSLSLSVCMCTDLSDVRFELFRSGVARDFSFLGCDTVCWLASRYRPSKDTCPWAAWHMMMMMMMMALFFFETVKNVLVDGASNPRRLESSGMRLSDFHPWNSKTCRSVSVVKRTEIYSSRNYIKNLMTERSCARGKFKAFLRRIFLKECEKEFIRTLINNIVSTTGVNGMRQQVSCVITL